MWIPALSFLPCSTAGKPLGAVRRLLPLPAWSPPTAELGVRHLTGADWDSPWRIQRFVAPNHCRYQRAICSISSLCTRTIAASSSRSSEWTVPHWAWEAIITPMR